MDRRLLTLDARRVPAYRFDVLIVGGGAAGASGALAAAGRGASVAVLTKGDLSESNTLYAQGGMAAVLSEEDSVEAHMADTLEVGCGLGDPGVVEHVVRAGPAAVEQLLSLGARFDRRGDGSLELSREGGHQHPRIIHARGDSTGIEIQSVLSTALQEHPNITCFPRTFVVDLLQGRDEAVQGCVVHTRGEPAIFVASQVILATGGSGQLFRETTNPVLATGDGVALGLRAGAVVRDLEFVQFHPTCLYIAGAARVLISEIVRGAGGVLRDRNGQRFMPEYHPSAELGPRDVVSRAVFRRMVETGDTSVYLDLSDIDGDPHRQFPGISRICRFFGIDIARDPVPVRPGAHYQIGGLEVDLDGRCGLPGLWAVGECASSGLHGANRMGSNSLLEGAVLGAQAGAAAAAAVESVSWDPSQFSRSDSGERRESGLQVNVEDVTYSLKSLMWRQMGVEREESMLRDALGKIALWTRAVRALAPAEPRSWELLNMLLVARLSAESALLREESRGVHWRTDHPQEREEWRAHTRMHPQFDGLRLVGVRGERVEAAGAAQPQ